MGTVGNVIHLHVDEDMSWSGNMNGKEIRAFLTPRAKTVQRNEDMG